MIKTERLIIKPIVSADEKVISELFTDNIVKKTYILPDFKDTEHLHNYFLRILEISNGSDHHLYGIYIADSGELIGIINDTGFEKFEKIELGYALLPRYFNKGYATEALGALIVYMKELGYKSVVTGAFEENGASMRVMEKCGMKRIDVTEEYDYRGMTHKVLYYSI